MISNKFNLESDVDDLIFSTHGWEDIGSFNLDGAMAAVEDITTPYSQVFFFQ